ncbi:MAG: GlsB/YeaQ/YmgE family stress response membrane protein [Chloroflexi bacterium]|nr:MAG: GlsB/YeaQ/YmgE family stress response membrane protein [Chloroflexota bacterium]
MTLTHLLVLLIVGALAGLIGERLVSRGMPGGLIDVLHVVLAPELSLGGIPVLSAIIGAAIVVLLFSLVAGGSAFGRSWRRS